MKTAASIEEQEERKRARGDVKNGGKDPDYPTHNSGPVSGKRRGRIENLKPFPKGVSGNPGGKPKVDLAAKMAQACFEENWDAFKAAFTKSLLRGNAYAFKELADRAYGKLKEKHEIEVGPYHDLTEDELKDRIAQLEREVGVTHAEPQLPSAPDDLKPN